VSLYNTTEISMPPVGFEAKIPASERPQTDALDRAATGIGMIRYPDRPARSESLYRPSYRGPQSSGIKFTYPALSKLLNF
jgi:hypothetical protein